MEVKIFIYGILCGASAIVLIAMLISRISHIGENFRCYRCRQNYYKLLSGTLDNGITWNIDNKGTLHITGTGKIEEYLMPWTAYCDEIKNAVISNGIVNIAPSMFEYCSYLTNVTIPDSVKTIGEYAFGHCLNLREIHIPCGVTNIDEGAFHDCINLTEITIPDTVAKIGISAFDGCENLQSVKLSNSLSEISEHMFHHCEKLQEIVIPDNVTRINEFAFYDTPLAAYKGLEKITIPKSVVVIENNAFNGCGKLADVYYSGTKEDWDKIDIGSCNLELVNANIHFTDEN